MASEAGTVPDTFKHPERINRIHNRAIVIEGKRPFLGVKVIGEETEDSVYRKNTQMDWYLHFKSNHDPPDEDGHYLMFKATYREKMLGDRGAASGSSSSSCRTVG